MLWTLLRIMNNLQQFTNDLDFALLFKSFPSSFQKLFPNFSFYLKNYYLLPSYINLFAKRFPNQTIRSSMAHKNRKSMDSWTPRRVLSTPSTNRTSSRTSSTTSSLPLAFPTSNHSSRPSFHPKSWQSPRPLVALADRWAVFSVDHPVEAVVEAAAAEMVEMDRPVVVVHRLVLEEFYRRFWSCPVRFCRRHRNRLPVVEHRFRHRRPLGMQDLLTKILLTRQHIKQNKIRSNIKQCSLKLTCANFINYCPQLPQFPLKSTNI